MNYNFVGDVHGRFKDLHLLIDRCSDDTKIIQVGDMGLGFHPHEPKKFKDNFKFIRGNHDNPSICAECPNYLGDCGFSGELNLFYVSGAWSIDANMRIPFVSWWPDEELSLGQCQQVIEQYNETTPDYIVTHDCPDYIAQLLIGDGHRFNTRMGQLFNQLWQNHKPKLWIFGHYHVKLDKEINGTRFICLPELGEFKIKL